MSTNETIPTSAQLVIIGAGPGGYAAAFKAVELGCDVTLVDPEVNPGGVCLHRGCIPSKALLHVAKLVSEAEEAAEIGKEGRPSSIAYALRGQDDLPANGLDPDQRYRHHSSSQN